MPTNRPPQPSLRLIGAVALVVVILAVLWIREEARRPDVAPPPLPAPAPRVATSPVPGSYLFCTWNVENFFDDQDDPKNHDEDEDWFAANPDLVRQKVGLLTEALLRQNDGRGPDIVVLIEVENRRCVELLRDGLNARLPTELAYNGLVHRDNITGRRIEPAVLTRLETRDRLTRGPKEFRNRRILEAHLVAEGAPLVVLASHWTSRVTDQTDTKRSAYADAVYEEFVQLTRDDPERDVILSGDFNDEPDDTALIDHLHATGVVGRIRAGVARPLLLDLVAGLDPRAAGTYFYHGRWQFLDHILASPGLLDPDGWQLLPDTLRTENGFELRAGTNRAPHRFGNPKSPNPRGPSDHFALTVRLRVQEPATVQ